MSLSLCMIVKNEEDNLPRCLESVKNIVDEMIIVDTGSTDATVKIAESYGAKVHYFPWNGSFADARNESLKHAICDWILLMDADDEMPPASGKIILDLVREDAADAYYFTTVSYMGDTPGYDVMRNMNPRLMKNHQGYYFTNAIHEQIWSNIQAVNPNAKIICLDIPVYHYGYLNKNITGHNKRARNIELLERELQKNPDYAFDLFNLGNEYFAMGDNTRALEYYEKAYRTFEPNQGFSSKLVLKMVNSYVNLGRYEDVFKLVEDGLRYYPDFTDLEYMRGLAYYYKGSSLQALKYLGLCIEKGEAPPVLNVIMGAGTYRAYHLLGEIYLALDDYELAEQGFLEALKASPGFTPSFVKLVKVWRHKKMEPHIVQKKLEQLQASCIQNLDTIVFDALLYEKYYDIALKYIRRYEEKYGPTNYSLYQKSLCKLYQKKLSITHSQLDRMKQNAEYHTRCICVQALCKMLKGKHAEAGVLLNGVHTEKEDILVKVYKALYLLLTTGKTDPFHEPESQTSMYTTVIFDLLRVILLLQEFDLFEKSLNLLNLIDDKTVLLKLAKLYYNEDCYGLAHQELLRSIKIFDLMDTEGAQMLYKLKLKGY